VTPCSLANGYQYFGGVCCLYLEGYSFYVCLRFSHTCQSGGNEYGNLHVTSFCIGGVHIFRSAYVKSVNHKSRNMLIICRFITFLFLLSYFIPTNADRCISSTILLQ